MNGYVTMWTSIQGFKNMVNNKQFTGCSEKSKLYRIQIEVPHTAVMTFFENINNSEQVEFICYKKDLWL